MSDLVCAICASRNVNLINIDTGQLRDLYDTACGIKTKFINALPQYICMLCASYLTKFYNIQNQFRSGFQTTIELNSLIEQNPENDYVIDRSDVTMHPVLSHSEPDKMRFIEMKHQPYSMFTLKPQNQTKIHSFHIDINNTGENYHINKTECITEDEKLESVHHNDINENWHNNVPEKNVQNSGCFILFNDAINLKIDVTDKSLSDTTLDSLAKILPIKQEFRKIERYMVVKLLTDSEMKAVNEVTAYIRNGNLQDEEKSKVCDTCLFYVKGDMDSHKKRHEEGSATVCCICSVNLMSSITLQQHYLKLHLFKYICRICNEVLFRHSDARWHLMGVHQKSLKELSEVNEDRNTANTNLESHFNRVPSTPEEAKEIMTVPFKDKSQSYISCDVCTKRLKNDRYLLKKHQDKHVLLPGQVQCDICKYTYNDKYRLKRHYKIYHYWKYSCKKCDYVTTLRKCARLHKLKHLKKVDITTFKCEQCGKEFNKGTTLATHYRYAHPCNAVCNICGEAYAKEIGLKQHKKKTHTDEERTLSHLADLNRDTSSELYCKECDVLFIRKNGYDKHLLGSGKHTAINREYRKTIKELSKTSMRKYGQRRAAEKRAMAKPRKIPRKEQNCHICAAVLKGKLMARNHFRKFHRDDPYYLEHLRKEYKCDLCDYITDQPTSIHHHKKMIHSSLRPYKCPHCDATFKSKGNMQRHILVHTGERAYECEHCHKCFKQKSTCQLHIQTVHLKIPYPPWQNKNKKEREKREKNRSEKTTKKRKYEVKPEEVEEEEIAFYLEAQESATEYIMKENLVYSTTSNEKSNRVRVVSLELPT